MSRINEIINGHCFDKQVELTKKQVFLIVDQAIKEVLEIAADDFRHNATYTNKDHNEIADDITNTTLD